MELGISGRVALVAGGGRCVGRAVALALAKEGCDVVVAARTAGEVEQVAAEVRDMGRRALAFAADLRDTAELDRLFARVRSELGSPTLLVLSLAAYWSPKKLQFLSDAEARELLEGDLGTAVALCTRVLPDMVEARFGRIVALGSQAAHAGVPGGTLYAATKAGLEGLMHGIALDYSRRGITANVVSLGFVDTERLAARVGDEPSARERLERATARRSLVTAAEAADAVTFLCSERASAITGAVVDVTGGAHLYNL